MTLSNKWPPAYPDLEEGNQRLLGLHVSRGTRVCRFTERIRHSYIADSSLIDNRTTRATLLTEFHSSKRTLSF